VQMDGVAYVVDDDPSVRKSLRRLLNAAGYSVLSYASAQEFLEQKLADKPSCLILDVSMPGLSGLELQDILMGDPSSLPIIFISGRADIPMSVRAMKSGALDFLTKPFDHDVLLEIVRRALEKSRLAREAFAEIAGIRRRMAALTPREAEVLTHVVTGLLNRQIAARLGISEKTVKIHRGRLMNKLETWSVADLVRLTEKAGLPLPQGQAGTQNH
jgi:FixJ family two-component response regulator